LEAFSLKLKREAREARHSPPPSAEVKNEWSYTSYYVVVFHIRTVSNPIQNGKPYRSLYLTPRSTDVFMNHKVVVFTLRFDLPALN
jgi:hypothetical protein